MALLKLVATDLDGTLLKDDKTIGNIDYQLLQDLGQKKIKRVIATGRSMHSVRKVLPGDFPVDFVIFSTGSGIYDWNSGKIIFSTGLNKENIQFATKVLIEEKLDFTIHNSIPNNHEFVYHSNGLSNPDFENYCNHYINFANPWDKNFESLSEGAQLLSIMPHDVNRYIIIKERLKNFKVIRTTSPQNYQNMWVEVFNQQVSKGNALAYLCKLLKIPSSKTFSIGNDFNDLELLDFTRYSFVVANANLELKARYDSTVSNEENGFSHALQSVLNFD